MDERNIDDKKSAGSNDFTTASSNVKVKESVGDSLGQSTDRMSAEVDFSAFVISMATQAVILMGEAPHPETGERRENMEGARQTIEILGMLEKKTMGNLTKQEESLLSDILDNLRMTYVAKMKKS
jgi:hypothetical protein